MKILLIGSGGREHALAWAISGSALTESLVIAPGSDAMATLGRCAAVADDDLDGLLALAEAERPDLVVVGPEAPLVAGIVDRLEAAGIPAFGPSAAAAQLEGSKAFAREACARFGIHQPGFTVCADIGSARAAIAASGGACVIKADGLAAGKGVVVADTAAEAEDAA
ncbi:MAG: phosphoribosylamine--glycine ligase, partial [Pseudomonadota bacterium]|nr:phosphoribosylamine--glycine ligase [Pseudomonadota bacterium]